MLEKDYLSLIISPTDIAYAHVKFKKWNSSGYLILYWDISRKAEKEAGDETDTYRSNGSEKNSRTWPFYIVI